MGQVQYRMTRRLKIITTLLLYTTILSEKCVQGVDPRGKAPVIMTCDPQDFNVSEADLSLRGYTSFINKKYKEAFDCYTTLILRYPQEAMYHYNRALVAIELENYTLAKQDSKNALSIDPWSVKAHFFLGAAHLKMEEYDEACRYLYIAYVYEKEQRLCYGDDIASQLREARRMKWRTKEDERLADENKLGLFPYLKKLMLADKKRKEEKIYAESGSQGVDVDARNQRLDDLEKKFKQDMKDITTILTKADEKTKRRELPDYLSGRMSYKLLKNSVVTLKGDTFEVNDIEEYFRRYGNIDPLHPPDQLSAKDLVPNLAINDAAEAFLQESTSWLQEFEDYVAVNLEGDMMEL